MHTKNEFCRPYPLKLINELSYFESSVSIWRSLFQVFAPSIPPLRKTPCRSSKILNFCAKVTTNQKHETCLWRAVSSVLSFSLQLSLVSWGGSWRSSSGIWVCLFYIGKIGLGSLGLGIKKIGTKLGFWAKSEVGNGTKSLDLSPLLLFRGSLLSTWRDRTAWSRYYVITVKVLKYDTHLWYSEI